MFRLVRIAEASDLSPDDVLLYAPDERIIVPERHRNSQFLLGEGELRMSTPAEVLASNLGHAVRWDEVSRAPLSRRAALRTISERLAEEIGPYAELAVSEAASKADNIEKVIDIASSEIEGALARQRFRDALTPTEASILRAGFRFNVRRDGAGLLVSDPPTRALTYVGILAFARPHQPS